MKRATLVRVSIFLATVVAAWGVLSVGAPASVESLVVDQPAPQTYEAERSGPVVDEAETERLKQEARDAVAPVRELDPEIESTVKDSVNSVFDDVEALVIGDPPTTQTTIPELPTTVPSEPGDGTTTTTIEPEPAHIQGRVFVDVDGDGSFNPDGGGERTDQGLDRVSVEITTAGGEPISVRTGAGGVWSAEVDAGFAVVVVLVDQTVSVIPRGYVAGAADLAQVIECGAGEVCLSEDVGFVANLRPLEEVEAAMTAKYDLPADTISYLAAIASDDVIRAALKEPLHLPKVREETLGRVLEEFGRRITPEELQQAKGRQRTSPPLVFHEDTLQDAAGGEAAGEIVATYLQANYLIDEQMWQEEQDKAAAEVEDVVVEYTEGTVIVRQGEPLTQLHIDAINQTASIVTRVQAEGGLLAVLAVLVGLLGFYLSRFRPEFWTRPRMVALMGILVVLAAAAVRGTVAVQEATSWYVLPAVAFGFVTAVLFDSRIAVLMALAVGVLTSLGTADTGIAAYAVLATMAPIPLVSSVSSRGAFRNAVVLSSLAAALIAAATAWFFHTAPTDVVVQVVGVSVAWAFGISVVASLLGLAALQFFESAFDLTTTLSLLDLTDRNHTALQQLQEKAFGTFNHSLMVGTLAETAARAIGANGLLARAMAYYHDLGKMENPSYFIENQFGMANPHDELDPRESAEIVRTHVTAGLVLARRFKIPTDVATGIVSHHGDGVMRYFYEKAREAEGADVDVDEFRHIGHKPRTAESAILMLADAVEAACRAVFRTEEPTPDAVEKVVDRVMNEKVEDGQLSESPLTLGELTTIRKALLGSLVGHYHQRIQYPNFPGT